MFISKISDSELRQIKNKNIPLFHVVFGKCFISNFEYDQNLFSKIINIDVKFPDGTTKWFTREGEAYTDPNKPLLFTRELSLKEIRNINKELKIRKLMTQMGYEIDNE